MNTPTALLLAIAGALAAGCAGTPSSPLPPPQQLDALAAQAIASSFRDQGIATVERLRQDEAQAACSQEKPPADEVAARLMQQAQASVRWPAGGQYFGDWREGEKLAQNGRGMTWTDPSAAPAANGANCYNCHQISKQEISFGTLGPSLYLYGRTRGVADLGAPTAQGIVEYTWAKIYNSRITNACSTMPRFGHAGVLNETQLRDLMSLLLDPRSPVNQ